ncbi:MAG: magnesium-translocating P-type ATPase [Planctomycetaceae bacterium]
MTIIEMMNSEASSWPPCNVGDRDQSAAGRFARWLRWLFGVAILGTLIAVVMHLGEERELIRTISRARFPWLFCAFVLQAVTYLADAEVWRVVTRAAQTRLSLPRAYRLSLAQLFVDQVLPTGGLSGALLGARALEQTGIPRGVVMASLVVKFVSYYTAYVICLAGAVVILLIRGQSNRMILTPAIAFIAITLLLIWGVSTIAGRMMPPRLHQLLRWHSARATLTLLRQADRQLTRNPVVLLKAILLSLAIVLLDAGTMWVLIHSLGMTASVVGVFAGFMMASLFRTIGFSPGGLGTFEAASVLALKLTGVPYAVGLSATLLFRGLSFWLPMLPGLWFSKSVLASHAPDEPRALHEYWSQPPAPVAEQLGSGRDGLTSAEAARRLALHGPNELRDHERFSRLHAFWNQVRNPLVWILVFAAGASSATHEWTDAIVIVTIIFVSVGVGFWREYRAQSAAAALRSRVQTRVSVLRDAELATVPLREVVPGDVVQLSAGSIVPADGLILEATDFFANEGALTGESLPVEKEPGISAVDASLSERNNCVFQGTNIRSGTARCLVVQTGATTEFGRISQRLILRPPQTEFDAGVLRFGYLVTTTMFVMVLLVFAANVLLGRPPIETLLFSIALAVGLSPELLPAILSINLARGATLMSELGVVVRHLNAIENLGSMDVLCTDKTGTLTEGVVRLEGAYDDQGRRSARVLELAAANATLQSGLSNPLDDAIQEAASAEPGRFRKVDEVPYDFIRKRMSVVIEEDSVIRIVSKGAFEQILAICTRAGDGTTLTPERLSEIHARFTAWSTEGTRVLAIATRELPQKPEYTRDDECDLQFLGFLTFLDHPKDGVVKTIDDLRRLGVSIKVITGDNRLVSQHVAAQVGLHPERTITGKELSALHDEALWRIAETTEVFAEVDPSQKERIILALKKMGHVVGFLGDGINDAPAMHAADTSLSVDQAVDVAREAADFVLLKRDLDVIRRGIEQGRTTFANTLKYVLMTMSANLGNMASMAIASLVLPFLPLLAGQILLNNFLSDIPAFGLAGDNVDPEMIDRPRRWNVRFIGRFMIEFGLLSSVFDVLTFVMLMGLFHSGPEMFRTGWFVLSLLTELVVALIVRTRRTCFRSRPAPLLLYSSLVLGLLALSIPYWPGSSVLGFVPLPAGIAASIVAITAAYAATTELAKRHLYRSVGD